MTSKISIILKIDHPEDVFIFEVFLFFWFNPLTSCVDEGWQSLGLEGYLAISWFTLSLPFSPSLTISATPYSPSPRIRIFKAILSLNSWADTQQCSGHCELYYTSIRSCSCFQGIYHLTGNLGTTFKQLSY